MITLFLASVTSCAHANALFLPVTMPDWPAMPAAGLDRADALRSPAGGGGAWERLVRVARPELTAARDDVESAGAGHLLLNVREGMRLDVVVQRTAPTKWGYSLSGRVAGGGVGFATLVVHEDVVAGSIWTPRGSYELLPVGAGVHALRDVAQLPPLRCGGMLQPEGGLLQPKLDASNGGPKGTDDVSVVDILIVYTPAAEEKVEGWTGSPAAARSWIAAWNDAGVALTNDALERSGAFVSLNVVGFEKVDIGVVETCNDMKDGLFSDSVTALQDRFGADIVHATTRGCGGAFIYQGTQRETKYYDQRSYLSAGSSLIYIPHEIGHQFGIVHERREGAWGYVHGFTTEGCEKTIMSYGTDCYGRRVSDTRPPFYASPWRYGPGTGRPLGVARFSKERGASGPADAVLTLNRNRHRIANLRPSRSER